MHKTTYQTDSDLLSDLFLAPISKTGANLDFFLNAGPHLINPKGIGTIMSARHPSNVPAHCTPKLINICFENKGKAAPTADRIKVFAAKTEAVLDES